jgi:hypothetical protein
VAAGIAVAVGPNAGCWPRTTPPETTITIATNAAVVIRKAYLITASTRHMAIDIQRTAKRKMETTRAKGRIVPFLRATGPGTENGAPLHVAFGRGVA